MHYTIRDIPEEVVDALQRRAAAEGRSLDETVLEALRAFTTEPTPEKARDLSTIDKSWNEEDEANLRDIREFHDQIDPETWR